MAKNQIVIGRGGRDYWTDLKLTTLPDVSREHVRLRRDAQSGEFFIKDLSRLGTSVNGEQIPTSVEFVDGEKRDKNVEVKLPAKARIGLADVVFLDFKAAPIAAACPVIDAREDQSPMRGREPRGHGAAEQRRPRLLRPGPRHLPGDRRHWRAGRRRKGRGHRHQPRARAAGAPDRHGRRTHPRSHRGGQQRDPAGGRRPIPSGTEWLA